MINSKKQMFVIIGAFILCIMLGTITYAFFNYTRTGSANVIKTGHIAFNAEQSAQVTLSDLFPITVGANETVTASTPGVGSLSIHVTGDTSYSEGIEYLIKAVNVTGNNGTNLPISIGISYEANTGKSIGTEDENYFTNRGGNTSVYKVLSNDTIEEGKDLVVGYIAPDNSETGIDGTLTVMAYLDARNIAITDTTPEGVVRNVKTTGYTSNACETALDGVTNASTYCATASSLQDSIDNGLLTAAQIRLLVLADIVEEYTNGTTGAGEGTWVNNRTVLTTSEWNALQASGVSFQIKVEANEGTWVEGPKTTATFDTGSVVNTKLRKLFLGQEYNGQSDVLSNQFEDFASSDNDILERVDELPSNVTFTDGNILSSTNSEKVIYAWLDSCVGYTSCTIKYYTDADIIYLNEDSSNMFRNITYFTFSNVSSANFDASKVTDMSHMFERSQTINFSFISNWDVSNVTNMSNMFYGTLQGSCWSSGLRDASAISNWDVRNVTNFTNMFLTYTECGQSNQYTLPIFTLRPGTWNNSVDQDSYSGTYVPNN